MKNIKNLFLLAMMVLASITMAQNPANTQSMDYTPKTDHELLIQIVGELKGLHTDNTALRNEMNIRFDAVDKRFEAVDKRFDDNRFFMSIIASLFTALVGIVIGFAFWDRRSMLKPLEARVIPLETEMKALKAEKSLAILWEWENNNPKFVEFLKSKNVL